jgi:hypothetical protein
MICLTFDTDHMNGEGIAEFLRRYDDLMPGRGTFFLHNPFPDLFGSRHEVCPHPFIADLNAWDEDLKRIAALFPRPAKGVRPHSCVFSHMIGVGLHELGYTYVSQAQNLFDGTLKPFRHPWGIWELPIYYMDNMDFWMSRNWPGIQHTPFSRAIIERAVSGDALFVFDIHPIHIALNTRSHEDYGSVKDRVLKGASPFELRFPGRGAGVFFEELCAEMSKKNQPSFACLDALAHFGCTT